jgi:GTP-binding protein
MPARFITSAADAKGFPADSGAELAVAGRSNSGKSSAINRIVGQVKLARVSKTPGRTQLINFFELGEDRRLVDLPGYGFARVPERQRQDWRRLTGEYFSNRRSLRGLLITVDIRRGLLDLDRAMLDWADELGLAVMVLLTKADKLSRRAGIAALEIARRDLGDGVAAELFSALDDTGVESARAQVEAWLGASLPK